MKPSDPQRCLRHLAIAVLVLSPGPALACAAPPERAEYAVHHETYGEVGRHVITFSCEGDDLVVETRIAGEVRVLMVPLFKREGSYREVWRDGRLIAFASRIVDNGEVYEVTARASGDHTVIDGRRGRIEAPAAIVPNHPWNYAVLDRTLLFDTQRGRLQRVQVKPAGIETITVAGRAVAAKKYRVSGDLERELWYDEAGNWLRSRLEHDGAKITLTRESLPAHAGLVRRLRLGAHWPRSPPTGVAMAPRACLLAVLLVLSSRCARAGGAGELSLSHPPPDLRRHRRAPHDRARDGDAIVVEHEAELAVEILGFTAFHRRTRFHEVWQDDRLIAFDGLIEDDGEPFPVTARAEGDHLIVEGRAGRIVAPPAPRRANRRSRPRSGATGSST